MFYRFALLHNYVLCEHIAAFLYLRRFLTFVFSLLRCHREFSIENILFWDAAKEFEFDCENNVFRSMEEKNVAAASIYAEYVSREAPSPVRVRGATGRTPYVRSMGA